MKYVLFSSLLGLAAAKQRYELTVGYRWDSRDGHGRPIYTINGQSPGPVLAVDEGEEMEVFVENQLAIETTLHWHGIYQKDHPWNDGVPGVTQYAIQPRDNFTYRFVPAQQYGSYFYHGHFGPPLGDGLRGPMWVRPASWRPRPYKLIDEAEVADMTAAERNPRHLVLADWAGDTMASRMVAYRDAAIVPSCANSVTVNGRGRTYCLDADRLAAQGRDPMGCIPQEVERQFGNPPAECEATDGELEVVEAGRGERWLWLNFIHGGVHHDLQVSVDDHDMWVVAADGEFVRPQRVQTARVNLAERISVLVRMDEAKAGRDYAIRVTSLRAEQTIQGVAVLRYPGSANRRTAVPDSQPWVNVDGTPAAAAPHPPTAMDEPKLAPHPANPPPATSDRTLKLTIDRTTGRGWALNAADGPHQAFRQQIAPMLWDEGSRGPTTHTGSLRNGSVVDVVFINGADVRTQHPFHKHNHKAWIIGQGSGGFPWESVREAIDAGGQGGSFNLVDPPRRDGYTLGAAPGDWTVIRYEVFFPAISMLHCHMIHHFAAGQQVIILEGADQLPQVPEEIKHRVHATFQPHMRYGPLD